MDEIAITGMRLMGRHGAYAGEKDRPQPFDVTLKLSLDLSAAAQSDALADTLDYAELHRRIAEVVETRSFDLLERLCAEIVRVAFEDERVREAEVSVAKPGRLNGATATVTLRRARNGPSD
ncbi:MAG TPA: dihydroneopterin aldolase [Candidatus Elarobacter sp.]|nr:dihydroneopterin aldolase [Candidatus Elarobacter sp.]